LSNGCFENMSPPPLLTYATPSLIFLTPSLTFMVFRGYLMVSKYPLLTLAGLSETRERITLLCVSLCMSNASPSIGNWHPIGPDKGGKHLKAFFISYPCESAPLTTATQVTITSNSFNITPSWQRIYWGTSWRALGIGKRPDRKMSQISIPWYPLYVCQGLHTTLEATRLSFWILKWFNSMQPRHQH